MFKTRLDCIACLRLARLHSEFEVNLYYMILCLNKQMKEKKYQSYQSNNLPGVVMSTSQTLEAKAEISEFKTSLGLMKPFWKTRNQTGE